MRGSLLTNAALYRCLAKLLATCELFAENVARVLGAAPIGQDDVGEAEAVATAAGGGRRTGATTTMNAARKRQRRSQVRVRVFGRLCVFALRFRCQYENHIDTLPLAPSPVFTIFSRPSRIPSFVRSR
jgi:hypothetical protein